VKHSFVAREQAHFPLDDLCRLLGVGRSGFHDYERRLAGEATTINLFVNVL